MNEDQKIDTDELISLYLDGEASVRQQTELKRLMQHDPSIVERINAFQRQQQILKNLPLETAPADLLENIRCEMERKLILSDFVESPRSFWASSHLLARRMMTAAAMIVLPLGLLALVVFQILKPVPEKPGYVPTEQVVTLKSPAAAPTTSDSEVFQKLPFNGALVLKTDQYMTVSRAVEKMIFEQGLLNQTLPSRTADAASFDITASPQKVAGLMESLSAVRPQCQSVVLKIIGASTEKPIEIADPQIKQVKMLVYENSPDLFNRLASRYASANQKSDSAFAKNQDQPELTAEGYPQPSIPTLAGNYDSLNQTVRLTIQVERNAKE